jgi:hypothetical protein
MKSKSINLMIPFLILEDQMIKENKNEILKKIFKIS